MLSPYAVLTHFPYSLQTSLGHKIQKVWLAQQRLS